MKILKKGGSREKGEEETKSMPHAPVIIVLSVLPRFTDSDYSFNIFTFDLFTALLYKLKRRYLFSYP
jgi:hypothetical protein